jgi:hypothetical protein
MKLSRLERYIEILKVLNEESPLKSLNNRNMRLEEIVFPKADIDFLIKQRVIVRCNSSERNAYKNTKRGTAILRYFTQNQQDVQIQRWVSA